MKRLALGMIALVLSVGFCFGADLGPRTSSDPGRVRAPYNWTGFYAGLFVGYGKKSEAFALSGNDELTNSAFASNAFPSTLPIDVDGPMFGGKLSYQYQIGGLWTLGAAVDLSYSDMKGSTGAGGNLIGASVSEKIRNYGTVRGEFGFLVTEWARLYGTAGYGWAQVQTDVTSSGFFCGPNNGSFVCPSGSSSNYRGGLVLGGGLEAIIASGWTVELTYLYNDFGTQRTVVAGSRQVYQPCECENPWVSQGYSANMDQNVKFQVIRVGLNHKF